MGFEAAGVVVELGARVKNLKVGDRITSLVSTGGYAEYATADATVAIPIPEGISFNEAATIPVQGLSAYAILKLAATIGANCTYRMMLPNQTTLASGGAASLDDFVHVVHHVKSSATPSSTVSITCDCPQRIPESETDGRQTLPYRITEGLPVIRSESMPSVEITSYKPTSGPESLPLCPSSRSSARLQRVDSFVNPDS